MRDDAWNTFLETGKVKDYLAYRHDEEKNTQEKEVRGEGVYGTDCGTSWNGFTDDARG